MIERRLPARADLATGGEHEGVDPRVAIHERREIAAVPGGGLRVEQGADGGREAHEPITRR